MGSLRFANWWSQVLELLPYLPKLEQQEMQPLCNLSLKQARYPFCTSWLSTPVSANQLQKAQYSENLPWALAFKSRISNSVLHFVEQKPASHNFKSFKIVELMLLSNAFWDQEPISKIGGRAEPWRHLPTTFGNLLQMNQRFKMNSVELTTYLQNYPETCESNEF